MIILKIFFGFIGLLIAWPILLADWLTWYLDSDVVSFGCFIFFAIVQGFWLLFLLGIVDYLFVY